MKIEELNGKVVTISKTSVTAYDENGKTCGVVRDVVPFLNASPRIQFEHSRAVRASGIWNNDKLKTANVIIKDGKLYYLHNTNTQNFLRSCAERFAGSEHAREYLDALAEYDELLENARKYVTVIQVRQ